MTDSIRDLSKDEWPELLKEINDPPKNLRIRGELPIAGNKLLAVVGSRKYSIYGKEACESLIAGLAGYPITIVSGLALGLDAIAHRAALRAGLQTIALPGSGASYEAIHPRTNVELGEEIIENGGGIISEFPDDMKATLWSFPKRNRIMAGMCNATIVIEAQTKSGTLITSRLATEYNREVGCVPGHITATTSDGPHMLIRLGAALIRNSDDILELLGLKSENGQNTLIDIEDMSDEEQIFIKLLETPIPRDELIRKSKLDTSVATATLSLLEIKGLITEELGEVRKTF
jgi:DNA processing protein